MSDSEAVHTFAATLLWMAGGGLLGVVLARYAGVIQFCVGLCLGAVVGVADLTMLAVRRKVGRSSRRSL